MEKIIRNFIGLLLILGAKGYGQPEEAAGRPGSLDITFQEESAFTVAERQLITYLAREAEQQVRTLLHTLPDSIHLDISAVDWDLAVVGGVSGRSDRHAPVGEIVIWISRSYEGGVSEAARTGLAPALYHEFHHLTRGWTIEDNAFGPGIATAAANEGLAVVFAEEYTGRIEEGNAYPPEAAGWVEEILSLPPDADYNQWVSGVHPDGRTFIGYRAGNFLVRTALERSGKDILELSTLEPADIYRLAGYRFSP